MIVMFQITQKAKAIDLRSLKFVTNSYSHTINYG